MKILKILLSLCKANRNIFLLFFKLHLLFLATFNHCFLIMRHFFQQCLVLLYFPPKTGTKQNKTDGEVLSGHDRLAQLRNDTSSEEQRDVVFVVGLSTPQNTHSQVGLSSSSKGHDKLGFLTTGELVLSLHNRDTDFSWLTVQLCAIFVTFLVILFSCRL